MVYTNMILILILKLVECIEAGNVILHSHHNKVLVGHSYRNISHSDLNECVHHCLGDCFCLSFQTCAHQRCQLCNSSRQLGNPTSLQDSENCKYFDFENDGSMELSSSQCSQGCVTDINCCLISRPCYNGGTCVPSSLRNKQRYTCKCPDGYEGKRCKKIRCKPGYKGENCQTPMRSCRDNYDKKTSNIGNYTIIDNANKPYRVICHFTPTTAWTLVQSYSLEKKDMFYQSFVNSHSVNENNPSWDDYRLSLVRMQYIRDPFNTLWRITCNFGEKGYNSQDLIRALVVEAPIFINAGERCVNVEYINIRGHACSNCEAFMVNNATHPLYFDPQRSQGCGFNVTGIHTCGGNAENSFGYYSCENPLHHCSSSPTSTTQLWLGGQV